MASELDVEIIELARGRFIVISLEVPLKKNQAQTRHLLTYLDVKQNK